MAKDKLVLKGLVFYAYHGVFPGEKELGQRYEVDVEIDCDLTEAAKTDDLESAIDYTDIYLMIKELMTERDFNLIEALCNAINEGILSEYDVLKVTTRVRKPQAPIGGPMEYVEVEMTRMQERVSVSEMCELFEK